MSMKHLKSHSKQTGDKVRALRSLLLVFVCAMILSASSISGAAINGYMRGDADGDEDINVIDATMIRRYIIGINTPPFFEKAADVNDDGLDVIDATLIQRYLVGAGNPHHIGEIVTERSPSEYDEYELPVV